MCTVGSYLLGGVRFMIRISALTLFFATRFFLDYAASELLCSGLVAGLLLKRELMMALIPRPIGRKSWTSLPFKTWMHPRRKFISFYCLLKATTTSRLNLCVLTLPSLMAIGRASAAVVFISDASMMPAAESALAVITAAAAMVLENAFASSSLMPKYGAVSQG